MNKNRKDIVPVSQEELEKLALEKKRKEKQKLTKAEQDKRVAEWQIFYLNNLDVFVEDYLVVKIHYFQRHILHDCWENDIEYIIASRGLSKSWTAGALAVSLALLLPGVNIGISSMTLGQANKIIDDKIDVSLSSEKKGLSPVLKQLRRDKYITFGKQDNSDGKIVKFGNGSTIFAVQCGEGGRGSRMHISILDEARLVKRRDYDAIIEPMLEPYQFNGMVLEPKQIFMTSARTKDSWVWNHLRKCVSSHYNDKVIKYGFFCGDIFTAVANKVQTKKQYITRKEGTNDFDFAMEFLNLWQGEGENSLFSFEDLHSAQTLKKAFYPRTTQQFLDGDAVDYKFNDNDTRYMTMDIAVSGGRDNDNTSIILGKLDEDKKKHVEYIWTKNGLNSMLQVVMIKRLFYEYKCEYFAYDNRGVGNVFYDMLTTETYDAERNVTYPAWTVCRDKKLQISSDKIVQDKIEKELVEGASEVIVPITGNAEINSNMHLALRKTLKDGDMKLLMDDSEMELILQDKDSQWGVRSAQYKADKLLPFLETRFTVNETVSLNTEFKEGGVRIKETSGATKDRYMTLAMHNFFGDKLIVKLAKDEQGEEVDISKWQFLAGIY